MPKHYQALLLILIGLLVSSCAPVRPRHGLAIDQMRAILRDGMQNNTRLATSQHHAVPDYVSNALIPSSNQYKHCKPQKRFDIAANQTPARAFFMSLVEGTSHNMVISPSINGEITLNLKNVTIKEALDAVRDLYGFEYRKNSYGYEILPPTIETKLFTLNYLDIKRKGQSITEVTSGQISDQVSSSSVGGTATNNNLSQPMTNNGTSSLIAGSTIDTTSEADFWRGIEKSLKAIVGDKDGRSVVVNSHSGVVIVHAFHPELHQVTRFLNRIQTNAQRQVILEAKVLEVQLNDQFQSGIDWNLLGKVISQEQGGIAQSAFDTFPTTALQDFNSFVALRVNGSFGGLIKLLQTQGNVQVLSSPRISTLNNQKAIIKVGTDQFFVTGVSTTNAVSTTATNVLPTQNINLTPFFSGVTLDVTPQISRQGEVILHIHPTVSNVKDQQKTIVLGNSGTSNVDNTYILPLAVSTIRESDNIVRASNGQMVVIGGLMQNQMSEETAGTPIFSKIPYFGTLFRRTKQLSNKIELVILLRPILTNTRVWQDEISQANKTIGNMRRGFAVGGLAKVFGNEGEEDCEA